MSEDRIKLSNDKIKLSKADRRSVMLRSQFLQGSWNSSDNYKRSINTWNVRNGNSCSALD